MRRDVLRTLGVELPVLPTIVLGALPGAPNWGERLYRVGLDLPSSGAAEDTPDTWRAARDASPYRPTKARSLMPQSLVDAGCRVIEGADADGAYRIDDDRMVVVVSPHDEVEDPNHIARPIVEAARIHDPSSLWVAAGPGLEVLDDETVIQKLTAMVEATVQARLALAKDQFDL